MILDEDLEKIRIEVKETILIVLKDRFDALQKSIDTVHGDLEHDRNESSQMRIDMAAVLRATKELLSATGQQTKRITEHTEQLVDDAADKVAEKVEPAMQQVMKKIKNGIPLNSKPWWQFWRR